MIRFKQNAPAFAAGAFFLYGYATNDLHEALLLGA
ncbi:hypothetical protein ABIC22_005881 [Paenibacillus sp. PvP094]